MKLIGLTLLLFFTFALYANDARACTCAANKPTVLDAYESADMVLVARVGSFTKAPPSGNQESYYPDDIRSVTVVVEKIYKGNTKVRHELTVQQGTGSDCVWNFGERDIGEKYLFYFKRVAETDVWSASVCGRTNRVEDAKEDLLYLDNLKKQRGKTRVSGKYGAGLGFTGANRTILIRGEEKTFQTQTDDAGIFEIYDLPAGKYTLEPELPRGWRMTVRRDQDPAMGRSLPFTLEPRKHVTFNLRFQPDTAIEGTVIGPDGNPLSDVCANLIRRSARDYYGSTTCTDRDGRFRFEGILAANYVLVVNLHGRISMRDPFPTIYYPNATELDKAMLISVGEGERVQGLNVVIPKLHETISVEGVLKYADDNPAAGLTVRFFQFEMAGFDGNTFVSTDANGRFRLKLLKGVKGQIHGDTLARLVDYENCPRIAALIKESDGEQTFLKTSPVRIEADKDEYVELRFPFPKCER